MKYNSAAETAAAWGISTRRVLKLAKEGRIDGAFKISNRWLIPASTAKPQDERKKTSAPGARDDAYKFPLFFYSVTADDYDDSSFSEEENRIISAMFHYERAELTECISTLEKLLPETDNKYLKISILYILVYAYHDTCNYEKTVQAFHKLKLAISHAEHQEELELIFQDVNSIFDGADWYANSFSLDFAHRYSKEFLVYCSALGAFLDVSRLFSKNPELSIASNELLCQSLEIQGCYYVSMFSHYYMSLLHSFKGNNELTHYHLKSAFETAEKYRLYSSFLYILAHSPNYEEIIRTYSSEKNKKELIAITENHKKAHSDFLKYLGKSTFYMDLTPDNYKYISYSMKGYTIEQMSREEDTTIYGVKKNLSILYKKFKVTSRKELLAKIHNLPL